MTLLEEISPEILRESSTPVLETERLTLRAPRFEDAKAVAALANDRRIAENTTRIPHPYRIGDAESFIAACEKALDLSRDPESGWLAEADLMLSATSWDTTQGRMAGLIGELLGTRRPVSSPLLVAAE